MTAADASLRVPLDIKLMNLAASLLFMATIVLGIAAVLWWAIHQSAFSIARVLIEGDIRHTNTALVRQHLGPQLEGNFFTINPTELRNGFEQLPWVRRAHVSRQFPNGLRVKLQEHLPRARWGAGGSAMINTLGEVFEAPRSAGRSDERDALPQLAGPDGSAQQVLSMFEALGPVFAPIAPSLKSLSWRDSGSWLVELSNGARLELGSGTDAQVIERARRFVELLPQASRVWQRSSASLEYADLRYTDGFALRLRGISTTQTAATTPLPAAAQPSPKPTNDPSGVSAPKPAAAKPATKPATAPRPKPSAAGVTR